MWIAQAAPLRAGLVALAIGVVAVPAPQEVRAHPVETCMADMIDHCSTWSATPSEYAECVTEAIGLCATHNPHPRGNGVPPGGPEDESAGGTGPLDAQIADARLRLVRLQLQRRLALSWQVYQTRPAERIDARFPDCVRRSGTDADLMRCRTAFAPEPGLFRDLDLAAIPDGQTYECDDFGLCWAVCANDTPESSCGGLLMACPSVQTHGEGACDAFCDGDDVCYCQC